MLNVTTLHVVGLAIGTSLLHVLPLSGGPGPDASTQPTTAAVVPEVVGRSFPELGLKLEVPRHWDVAPVRIRKGTRVLDVVDPSPAPRNRVWVRAKFSVEVRDSEIRESFDLGGPPPPDATVSEVIEVDGLKARLTGYTLPDGEQEMLMLRLAKPLPRGTRVLEIDMFFGAADRAAYLALADNIFRSVRFLPDAPAPPANSDSDRSR